MRIAVISRDRAKLTVPRTTVPVALAGFKLPNKARNGRQPEMKLIGQYLYSCHRGGKNLGSTGTRTQGLSLTVREEKKSKNVQTTPNRTYCKRSKETHQSNHDRPDPRQPGMGACHQPPVPLASKAQDGTVIQSEARPTAF